MVSRALAHESAVVTHERAADTGGKIKIPNACSGLEVRCINPFEMLRSEGARFILQTKTEEKQ